MKLFIVLTCCLALVLGYYHEGSSSHTGFGGSHSGFSGHPGVAASKRDFGDTHKVPSGHHIGYNHHRWTASKRGHFSIDGGLSHGGGDKRVNVGLSHNFKKRLADLEKGVADLKIQNTGIDRLHKGGFADMR